MAHSFNPDRPNPLWTICAPLAALGLLGAVLAGLPASSAFMLILLSLALMLSVFAAVHHAEIIALKVGEPFGSIVLALSVTIIEVALILAMMLSSPDGAPAMARDAVFAAVMIVLGGIIGFSLMFGGMKHHEQHFDLRGAAAALAVLATLSVFAFVLPNFAIGITGPFYAVKELVFVATVSLLLYGAFLFTQTVRHRDYFLQGKDDDHDDAHEGESPKLRVAFISFILLICALVAVVGLAKSLSPALAEGLYALGLPSSFMGILIALIVLLPEGLAAVQAAMANRLQTAINLALGSAIACIGLTIPAVSVVSLMLGQELLLGITPMQSVLLALVIVVSSLTLGSTGKTTVLQGAVHLVIFGVYLFLSAT